MHEDSNSVMKAAHSYHFTVFYRIYIAQQALLVQSQSSCKRLAMKSCRDRDIEFHAIVQVMVSIC